MDYITHKELVTKALANGGVRKNLSTTGWDIAGQCENAVIIEHGGYKPPQAITDGYKSTRVSVDPKRENPIFIDLTVPCRKCPFCLRKRAFIWKKRAETEFLASPRTWFGTLTLKPEQQQYAHMVAVRNVKLRQCRDFEALSDSEQFRARHEAISPEITRYLKRIRKQSSADFKYLLVTEAHKSGLPHYHILIHEKDIEGPLRYSLLSDQWNYGFSNYKLADIKSALYITKYICKDMMARVRASLHYGHCHLPK